MAHKRARHIQAIKDRRVFSKKLEGLSCDYTPELLNVRVPS